MRQPSNPITGQSPRPEQANQGTPWWKYDGPHQDITFPSQPQACCGRCQNIVHDFITSVVFTRPDEVYLPYNLTDLLLVSSPIRNTWVDEQAQLKPGAPPLEATCGPLLEYRRCHWKSKEEEAAVDVGGPPGPGNTPDVKGLKLQAWMFYGDSSQIAGGATGFTDIGNEGILIFNGTFPWIEDDYETIRTPLALTDSFVYLDAPSYDTPGEDANLEISGWCIAISNRKIIPAGPDTVGGVIFQPILLYQLAGPIVEGQLQPAPHPFRCQGENQWALVFNPLQASDHLLITKPFQP